MKQPNRCTAFATLALLIVAAGCTQPEPVTLAPPAAEVLPTPTAETVPEPPTATPSPSPSVESSVAPSPMPSASPSASPVATLTEQYTLKVTVSAFVPATFDVTVNGEPAGSFTATAEQDLTPLLKPGKNTVVVKATPGESKRASRYLESKLTVGVNRNGKWSTVVNVPVKTDSKEATRTYTIMAR